jgi:glycosyltransferase involved in cell wall biosynthesis
VSPGRFPRPIAASDFAIATNGVGDGPAQALREHLVRGGARRVVTISHPLAREGDARHEIRVDEPGRRPRVRRVALPCRPPYTYPLDLVVPAWPPAVDAWFGFNGLAAARGLGARAVGRAGRVVHWCVDFIPERFGPGAITAVYDLVDRLCCRRADLRVELSQAAAEGRDRRHGMPPGRLAPVAVVPMGAWLDRVPVTAPDAVAARRVVFLGHLVERQGVGTLIDAIAALARRGAGVQADIVGQGELEPTLRRRAAEADLTDAVHFHGFVPDHRDVERVLATGSVAVAPYATRNDSFTRFADPGKLKAYLAAGLPILTTSVPPNAGELAAHGGAEVVPDDAEAFADAIQRTLASPEGWARRREAALAMAARYDWPTLLDPMLERLGFVA